MPNFVEVSRKCLKRNSEISLASALDPVTVIFVTTALLEMLIVFPQSLWCWDWNSC